jgi:hypothetical protein
MTTTTATRTTPARPEQDRRTPRPQGEPNGPTARPTLAMQRRLIARLVG